MLISDFCAGNCHPYLYEVCSGGAVIRKLLHFRESACESCVDQESGSHQAVLRRSKREVRTDMNKLNPKVFHDKRHVSYTMLCQKAALINLNLFSRIKFHHGEPMLAALGSGGNYGGLEVAAPPQIRHYSEILGYDSVMLR